jgi:hypothetical protein
LVAYQILHKYLKKQAQFCPINSNLNFLLLRSVKFTNRKW